ncbi:MAG: polyprenyl synthetase family protein [Anaerolineales bacterium]
MATLDFQTRVQDLLPEVEERMGQQVKGYHPILQSALDHLLSSGGKRVRPTLALLTSSMLGVGHEISINLAAAVELLHTATLVHDDLIDGASLRRGTPTINAELSDAATILTGDFLFSQAAWLGSQVKSVPVMALFAKTLSTIVNGEIVQIFERNAVTNRQAYIERIYAKTASMFELAAAAPSYIVNQEDRYFEPLRAYGYGIGMAFQMVDDVLDFSSDAATMGKPVASDLRLGLVTLPTLHFLEANPNDERMQKLQNGSKLDEGAMETLVADIRASGAVQRAHVEADAQAQNALDALEQLPAGPERQALAELAEYVVARLH